MTTAPNGELRRQDLHLQVQQLVSLRSLLRVSRNVRYSVLAVSRRPCSRVLSRAQGGHLGGKGIEPGMEPGHLRAPLGFGRARAGRSRLPALA